MAKKLVEPIMPSTVFDIDWNSDLGRTATLAGAALARIYNSTPEQNLAHHTENTRHKDQLPSAQTQPEPHRLLMPLDSSQQSIAENKETQHCRELVTVRMIVLADRDSFSRCAIVDEKEPNKPDRYVQSVVTQDHPQR